ncbi:MAG: hypothetical protein N3G78_06630 [Desulfobacterota bacterium]|nr:hypothetical protein [Thermodesulfobacteriota bacterium]
MRGAHLKAILLKILIFSLSVQGDPSHAFRRLGTPIQEGIPWGVYVGPGKSGRMDTLYVVLGRYQESVALLSVSPDTGEVRQFNGPLPSEMGSWGFALDQEGRIYLGTYYRAHLLRFDPKTERWEDLGRPAGEGESFICSLTTAPDGKIWGGTFPSAKLFSYDPKTGKMEDHGRMDEKEFYCYPTAGEDGLIYCAIRFSRTDIVVFDPATKAKRSLLPSTERQPGWLHLTKGRDGKVYAKLPSGRWYRAEKGTDLVAVSESEIPFPRVGLPDGRRFHLIDPHLLRIENPATGEVREIVLRHEASGAFLFLVGSGPEGRIYGSSMLPLRLFNYDPQTGRMANLGKASFSTGQIYSMGPLGGKLYLCAYPSARLSVYDPAKPLHFGDGPEANPRDLGPFGEGQDRPRAMIAGPQGKVYVGSYPDYGLHGGALNVYDPERGEKRVYRDVVPNQSLASLAFVESLNLIVAGSSVRGGGGTRALEKEAKLLLWDPRKEKKVFETIPVPEAKTILSLAATPDGLVFGITDNEKVFVFDPASRTVRSIFPLGLKNPVEVSLQRGPEGLLYGLTREMIFFIQPGRDEVFPLGKPPVPVTAGMAIGGRQIYFGSHADLYEFEIPSY